MSQQEVPEPGTPAASSDLAQWQVQDGWLVRTAQVPPDQADAYVEALADEVGVGPDGEGLVEVTRDGPGGLRIRVGEGARDVAEKVEAVLVDPEGPPRDTTDSPPHV